MLLTAMCSGCNTLYDMGSLKPSPDGGYLCGDCRYEVTTSIPAPVGDLVSALPLIAVDLRRELADAASRDGAVITEIHLSWSSADDGRPWVRATAVGARHEQEAEA